MGGIRGLIYMARTRGERNKELINKIRIRKRDENEHEKVNKGIIYGEDRLGNKEEG